MDVSMLAPFTNVECPECGEHNRVKTDVGSYILMKRQGVGGMSLVFGAVDKTLGREVAIKILNEEYSMDEKRISQFELEARITAAMSHPHIVKVFTVGQAFNRFFIAMELISGDSLEKKMADHGKLSESEILNWAQQIADGLNAANESGLIHRDIKPGNILFDKDGHVKIVDFGLALVTQGGKAQADEIWATPFYVPPEALDVLEEDFRSDIYALGASLFHALSGQPPFTTESRSTTELKEIKRNLPSLKATAPWLSDETCAVIDKAMAFEMDDRFSSYQELIDAFHYAETVVNHEGEHPPMSSAERARRRVKAENHSSWKIPAIAGAAVLIIGGVLFAVLKDGKKPPSDDSQPVTISQSGGGNNTMSKRVGQEITLARGSLKNRNYKEAARRYSNIASDSNVSKDTIYWAGLQAATVHWLNGNSGKARIQLRQLAVLSKKEGNSGSETGRRLVSAVDSLTGYQAVNTEDFKTLNNELDAMIAFVSGLKNWSLGRVKDALVLFDKVERFQADEPSEEYTFYRARIADYKHDAALLESFRSGYFPTSMDELNKREARLQGLESKLKTKGRVLFDLEEWKVQCDIHKKRLIREAAEALAQNNNNGSKPEDNNPPPNNQVNWAKLIAQIKPDLTQCEFAKVEQLLELQNFNDLKDKNRAEQLSYLCQNASGYKATVRRSLTERRTNASITLKVGAQKVTGISNVTNEGFEVQNGGDIIKVRWGDVEPSSLLDLHKYNVSSNLSDFEKNLRLEQAICFAWLTGETTKAQNGAVSLAKVNPIFKARWKSCMGVLAE